MKKTLLLVEDESVVGLAKKLELEQAGYGVLLASNGAEASRIISSTADAIDLALVNIALDRGKGGVSAAKSILALRDLPILFLYPRNEGKLVNGASAIPSYGFVPKDSDIAVLDASIRAALRVRESSIQKDSLPKPSTENKLTEMELAFRSLIEYSNDVIFCVDLQGNYRFVNNVFAGTFGKTPDYFIGKNWWDIYPKEHADQRQEVTERVARTGETESVEVVVPLPDRNLHFLAKSNPVKDAAGKVVMALTYAIDITNRKLAEEKVATLLREKEILFKEFRHRVKNNLSVVVGLLSIQASGDLSAEAKSVLHDTISKVQTMSVLYDKLHTTEGSTTASLKDYLESLIAQLVIIFDRDSINIGADIDDVTLDTRLLAPIGIIVNELITNSIKYAFPDSVKGRISLTARRSGENLIEVIVSDDGVGLPKDVAIGQSAGAGMQLVELLVQQIRGKIRILREHGTAFVMEIPV